MKNETHSVQFGVPGDLDSWMELVREVRWNFPGLETQEALEEHRQTVLRFMETGRALCVKDGDNVAGVLLLSQKHNLICCLAVAPECRRRGIARALMEKALSQLDPGRDIAVTTFRTEDARGTAPRALYQSFGFEPGKLCEEFGYPVQEFVLRGIQIEEIPVERVDEFWQIHMDYLIGDGLIEEEGDVAYFGGDAYRELIRSHMLRPVDRHHMIYFVRDGVRIGAAQYNTYQSEDGKCFVLDYWVFPEFRGKGTGHWCFAALERYTKADGAVYYELNCDRENAHRFWESLGFTDSGADEYDMPLMIRKNGLPEV